MTLLLVTASEYLTKFLLRPFVKREEGWYPENLTEYLTQSLQSVPSTRFTKSIFASAVRIAKIR
jgi:hypothetical protein